MAPDGLQLLNENLFIFSYTSRFSSYLVNQLYCILADLGLLEFSLERGIFTTLVINEILNVIYTGIHFGPTRTDSTTKIYQNICKVYFYHVSIFKPTMYVILKPTMIHF